jgi:DNA modification methylase
MQDHKVMGKEYIDDKKKTLSFNKLTPTEWTKLSKSVWNDVSSPRQKHHLEHGATFSMALAERAIKIYSAEGDLVLDPFLGVGTTLLAAYKLGRMGIGFEIYEKFVTISKSLFDQRTLYNLPTPLIIHDDCRKMLDYMQPNTVQLTFTSPPYANFIHRSIKDRSETHKNSILVLENKSVVKPYGEDVRDFGNLSYEDFLIAAEDLMKKIYIVTKNGGYNVWVVKDCRDPQNGKPFIPLHADLAKTAEKAGFSWHDLIIWDQNEQRRLVLLGYPTKFYVNINHTFLVVLRKN